MGFYSLEEGIANDIIRLSEVGELFTTDGQQITFEFLKKLAYHSRVLDNIEKDVINKLQTSYYKGYTTSLAYIIGYREYDFELVKQWFSEILGSDIEEEVEFEEEKWYFHFMED